MPTIFPVLQSPNNFDTEQFAARSLVEGPGDIPLVTYLRQSDEGDTTYVTWQAVERSKRPSIKALNTKAITDLTHREDRPGWNRISVMHRGWEALVLERTGDYLTASDILDPEILQIANHCLGTGDFYIGIPHACCMLASTNPSFFSHLFHDACDEAEQEDALLFSSVFRVKDEQLVAIATVVPSLFGPNISQSDQPGIMRFIAPYRGDFELLKSYITSYLPDIIADNLNQAGFGGKVILEIPTSSHEFDINQCRELGDIEQRMNTTAKERNWKAQKLIDVSIEFSFTQKEFAERGLRNSVLGLLPGI